MEGDGAGSLVAGSAVHGAGVPLALAARREGMPPLSAMVWLSGSCPHPCTQAQPVPQAAFPALLSVLWQGNPRQPHPSVPGIESLPHPCFCQANAMACRDTALGETVPAEGQGWSQMCLLKRNLSGSAPLFGWHKAV